MPNLNTTNLNTAHEDAVLMRLLLGEISSDERTRLEQRLDGDTALRDRLEQLRATWDSLEMASAPALPENFRSEILEVVRGQARDSREVSWSETPTWARAAAALTLVLGMVVGLGLGHPPPTNVGDTEFGGDLITEFNAAPMSLAEAYWLELETQDNTLWNEDAWGNSSDEGPL